MSPATPSRAGPEEDAVRFADKVALVTGAASGIGRATARRLADEGARVYATDLSAERVAEAFDGDERVVPVGVDVADSSSVDQVYARLAEAEQRLDVVVNAAGIADSPRRLAAGADNDITGITDEDFRIVTEVNLYGTFYSMRAAIPLLRRNGPAGGSIVNISSVGALANFPLAAAYPATKAGVLGLTRAVAALVAADNIRVNAVAPGATDTPMMPADPAVREAVVALGVLNRVASAEEMAGTIAFVASDEAAFLTGQTISPNGGYVM